MNRSEGDASAGISLKVGSPAGSVILNGGCHRRCTPPVVINAKRHWVTSLSNWVHGESRNSKNFELSTHRLKSGGYLSNNLAINLSFFCLMPNLRLLCPIKPYRCIKNMAWIRGRLLQLHPLTWHICSIPGVCNVRVDNGRPKGRHAQQVILFLLILEAISKPSGE